jgi:hypothetical protein
VEAITHARSFQSRLPGALRDTCDERMHVVSYTPDICILFSTSTTSTPQSASKSSFYTLSNAAVTLSIHMPCQCLHE